jgi:hypothetical protein
MVRGEDRKYGDWKDIQAGDRDIYKGNKKIFWLRTLYS